jgi:SAM-dependent methyltransferase
MRAPAYELTRCIVCSSADSVELADDDGVRIELEELWAFHGRRLRPDIPAQRLMDRVAFSEPPPVRLVRCTGCGFVYRNPIERGHEVADIYEEGAPAPEVLRSLHATQRRAYRAQARRLMRVLGRRGSGIEVGSYVGAFLAAARAVGLRFEGVDVNPDVNAFTRALGFTVHDGELTDLDDERAFDAVAIWNCFDQLADPRAAVHAAWRLLRPNGVLAIRVPNGAYYARLRPALARRGVRGAVARALLAQNNLLGFPYRFGFTARSLALLLERSGFALRRVEGDVLVPIADEWTRGWAAAEERVVKLALGVAARARAEWAPWLEVYAARRE